MAESLDQARDAVADMIDGQQVPHILIGDIGLEDLVTMVESMVEQGIKDHLQSLDSIPDDDAVEQAMNQVALQVALVSIQATIAEMSHFGITSDTEDELSVTMSPEEVSELLTRLLSGAGVRINLAVRQPEPS